MRPDPAAAEPDPGEPAAPGHEADGGGGAAYDVTIPAGTRGVLVGDNSTQVNIEHLHVTTWTDGVAPEPLADAGGEVESPYRGLDAFGEADARFFFGRDGAVEEVLGRLAGCADPAGGSGLLVLSGVSGSGKTSLLQAGVLPRLRQRGLPGLPEAAAWPCVVLVPGARPLDELAVRVAPAAQADAGAVRRSLGEQPGGFALTARQAAAAAGASRVLLVVDQFETVLTQCEQPGERAAFIAALDAAAGSGSALVVIAIRADLEAKLADYPDERELQAATQRRYLLGAMTERQLRLAITQPAAAVGSSVSEDLVAELLRTVRAQAGRAGGDRGPIGAGVLPLLSHALDQAWRERADPRVAGGGFRPLTLADYEATGGIERAVQDSAQAVYGSLTPARQLVARQVFTRLTATTAEGIDTAVRASAAELLAGRDAEGAADVSEVLRAFAARRLLTLAAGSVEISHEALLSAWPLLRDDWLAGTRADRAARARLAATVADWVNSGRDRSFLYSGRRLDDESRAARRIASDGRHAPLSEDEAAFLTASRHAQARAARIRRASAGGGLALVAGIVVAVLIATQSAGGYLRERGNARAAQSSAAAAGSKAAASQRARQSASYASQSLAMEGGDPQTARAYAVKAWQLDKTPQSRYALVSAASNPLTSVIPGDGTAARSVAVSPDGKVLAVGYSGVSGFWVELYDSGTGHPVSGKLTVRGPALVVPPRPSGLPALPSGPSPGATVSLGVPGPAQSDLGNSLLPLAFSPDGKAVAAGAGGALGLWDVATGAALPASSFFTPVSGIDSVAFSPDGKTLLVGGQSCLTGQADSGCAELWNAATGAPVGAPVAADGHLLANSVAAAFSADGTTIVTAGSDGKVRLWSTATRQQSGPVFPAQHGAVEALAVSPRGGTLATAGDDGTVRLWNMATGTQAGRTLTTAAGGGGASAVTALAFSRDGTLLAGADANGSALVWNVASGRLAAPALPGGTETDVGVAFSPDGTTVTSANTDGTARQWNLPALRGRPAAPPVPTGAGVTGDGMGNVALGGTSSLVTTDEDGNVGVWVSTGGTQQPSAAMTVANPPVNPDDPTFAPRLALSPDGRRLVTGGDNGTIQLWDLSPQGVAGNPVKTIPVPETLTGAGGNISVAAGIERLAFSPDGRRFAAAYGDDEVQVFDAATGQPAGSSFTDGASAGSLLALSFTPDGDLVTADMTGMVATWNPRAGAADDIVAATKLGLAGEPGAMAVTPDGQALAAGFPDGTVQLWDTGTNQQIGGPVSTSGGNIDSLAFSPDGTRLASAGDDGAVRLWDVSYLSPARDLARLR